MGPGAGMMGMLYLTGSISIAHDGAEDQFAAQSNDQFEAQKKSFVML
jgi:hypothetical protein